MTHCLFQYERIISEYYCSAFGYKGEDRENPVVFNKWLAGNLTLLSEKLQGHMLPQHYYVYDENGDKVVTHILRFENLQTEFDALMEQYGLPVRMPPKSSKTVFHFKGKPREEEMINVNSILPENILKINEVYSRDFEFFGYPMIKITPSMSVDRSDLMMPDNPKPQQQTMRIPSSHQQAEPIDQNLNREAMSRVNEQVQQPFMSGTRQTQGLNEDNSDVQQQRITMSERQMGGRSRVGSLNQDETNFQDDLNMVARSSREQITDQLMTQSGPNNLRVNSGQLQQSQMSIGNEGGKMSIAGMGQQQTTGVTDSLEPRNNFGQALPVSRSQQGNRMDDNRGQDSNAVSATMHEQTSRMALSSNAGNVRSSQSEISSGMSTRGNLRTESSI
jgi:hypothetical protein